MMLALRKTPPTGATAWQRARCGPARMRWCTSAESKIAAKDSILAAIAAFSKTVT